MADALCEFLPSSSPDGQSAGSAAPGSGAPSGDSPSPFLIGSHVRIREGGPSAWKGQTGVVKIKNPSGAHVLMDSSRTLVRFWNFEMGQVDV